jgi:hypothetical protein
MRVPPFDWCVYASDMRVSASDGGVSGIAMHVFISDSRVFTSDCNASPIDMRVSAGDLCVYAIGWLVLTIEYKKTLIL